MQSTDVVSEELSDAIQTLFGGFSFAYYNRNIQSTPELLVAELVTKEVNLQATLTGIDSLWIKSTMMRIQDGRM